MVHYYYPSSGQGLSHSFVRGSHIFQSQLPGKHTGHKAASRHSEPILECTLFLHLHHHCQEPILHLGEVRHMWSSHLAQGCYSTAGPSHVSHYGSNAGRTVTHPCIIQAHDCLTSVIKRKMFAPCYVSYSYGVIA